MARKKPPYSKFDLKPKTENQKLFLNSIKVYPMTIALGPAGTGKSFLTAVMAAKALKEGQAKNIVVTRPTLPTGRSIGFFPGTLEEKMDPWCKPILVTLQEYLGKGDYDSQIRNKNIEVVPFETIRGRSFGDSFVILDEAQNCTVDEIKAFVTRIGEHSKAVINGDISQSDLHGEFNGLECISEMVLNSKNLRKFVSLVAFTKDDIVRSGLCQMWVEEFEERQRGTNRLTENSSPVFLRQPDYSYQKNL